MSVCKNILENSLQKFLTPLLVLSFITFTGFAFAEDKIPEDLKKIYEDLQKK